MSDNKKNNTSVNANEHAQSEAVHSKSFEEISKLKKAKEKKLSNETVIAK